MKEVKGCSAYNCERTLPESSKHTRCVRCRRYDKRVADKPPSWQRALYETYGRRTYLLEDFIPKKHRHEPAPVERNNVRALPPPAHRTQMPRIEARKRA